MKNFLALLALCAVCLFITFKQSEQMPDQSGQGSFPEGEIIYLISY